MFLYVFIYYFQGLNVLDFPFCMWLSTSTVMLAESLPVQFSLLWAFDAFGQGWLMSSLWVCRFSDPLHALCDCFYASALLFCYSCFVTVCEIWHSYASSYESEVLVWLLIVQGDFEHLMSSDLTLLGLGLLSVSGRCGILVGTRDTSQI